VTTLVNVAALGSRPVPSRPGRQRIVIAVLVLGLAVLLLSS
jgi:hypothetical protein